MCKHGSSRPAICTSESKLNFTLSGGESPWLTVDLKGGEHFYVQITASNKPAGTRQDSVDAAAEFLNAV